MTGPDQTATSGVDGSDVEPPIRRARPVVRPAAHASSLSTRTRAGTAAASDGGRAVPTDTVTGAPASRPAARTRTSSATEPFAASRMSTGTGR